MKYVALIDCSLVWCESVTVEAEDEEAAEALLDDYQPEWPTHGQLSVDAINLEEAPPCAPITHRSF